MRRSSLVIPGQKAKLKQVSKRVIIPKIMLQSPFLISMGFLHLKIVLMEAFLLHTYQKLQYSLVMKYIFLSFSPTI